MRVVREELRHLAVGLVDVFRIARQRDPAKRSLAFAEERADVGGNEARKRECVRHALVVRDLTDVVAVVEGRHPRALEREHGLDVGDDRVLRRRGQRRVLRRIGLRGAPALDRPAGRQIAVDEVVRRRLIGDHVGPHSAPDELRQDLRRVAEEADGHRAPGRARVADDRERVVEILRLAIEITGCEPHLDPALLAFDREHRRPRHRGRQRLRAAHAAQTGGEYPAVGELAAVVLAAGLRERLVGALHDALAADVDPRAGRHLAVHHEALAIELVEVLPRRPARHEVRVGDEHARRVRVRLEHADRLAGLDQQRFVVARGPAMPRGSRRSTPSCGRRDRCRRTPRAPCGFSATSGSRLFWIMRSAASVSQLFAVRSGPRGARMTRSAWREPWRTFAS